MPSELVELIDAQRIAQRVVELAERVSGDYRQSRELVTVGVLKGAFVFLADLVRRLTIPVTIDFVRVASYGSSTDSAGVIRITKDLELGVAGKDVLVVEDIIDTGLTLKFLVDHLKSRAPRSVRTCVLLDKPARRRIEFVADYVGFEIEDHFVVGYGLDCNEQHRYLPYIAAVRPNGHA